MPHIYCSLWHMAFMLEMCHCGRKFISDVVYLTFLSSVQFSSVQSLSRVRLFATPWIAARQASLSITNSWSSLSLKSIESVMPSSHLILCRPLLLPLIPPSIRVFSNESSVHGNSVFLKHVFVITLSFRKVSSHSSRKETNNKQMNLYYG